MIKVGGIRKIMVLWQAVFLAASPLVTATPSNLTRLYYNGSAAKCHSTTTQYRQLRRLHCSSALTLVDSVSGCELQTPTEARFWDQKLSYCYTSGFPLHKFSSRFCVNRSCLIRVFLQKFIVRQYAAPSAESLFWRSFHFHSFTKSFYQHIKNADLV